MWKLKLSSYRMFISFCNLFAIFSETRIFYEFNCMLMIFYRKIIIIHK
ncbi:MADS-transcription factor 68 [Zea mays]|uniref:MADS-transcription factor 68 n=1 Tax=Zea mays TaxID=4577 RepID=A0A1D6JR06_MAIZE|nr:MADS-transcription factor 68 [Zea mays]